MSSTSTGLPELMQAVRTVLIADSTVSGAGVFYQRAPREDKLPYVVLALVPLTPTKTLKNDAFRYFQLQAKVCAADDTTGSAMAVAKPIVDAIYQRMTAAISGSSAQARLNTALASLGWQAMQPLEKGDIQPYMDTVGDVQRWNFGNRYDLRIMPL